MHPEEIFDEFKVLVCGLPFNLPYHEDGGVVYPFAWNSSVKGEFNIFNLFRHNDWIHLVDIDSTVEQWKGLGYARKFDNLSSRTREVRAWQDGIETLLQEIEKFSNLQAYNFRLDGEFPNNIIIAQIKEGDWVGITSTVYVQSYVPEEVIDLSPIDLTKPEIKENQSDISTNPSQRKITSLMPQAPKPEALKNNYLDGYNILSPIVTIVRRLKGIEVSGDFGCDYPCSYNHKMVIGMGKTRETAWQNTLQASGMLELSTFNKMYKNREDFPDYYLHLSERKINDIFKRYAKITTLLKQELDNPIVYRISCGISEHIYILGQIKGMEGDKLGIYIKSNFVYNP